MAQQDLARLAPARNAHPVGVHRIEAHARAHVLPGGDEHRPAVGETEQRLAVAVAAGDHAEELEIARRRSLR